MIPADDPAKLIAMRIIRDANVRLLACGPPKRLAMLLAQRAHRLAAVARGGYD